MQHIYIYLEVGKFKLSIFVHFPFWCLSSCATSGREGESSIYLPVVSCLRSGCTGDVDPRPQRVHHPSANEVSFLRFAMKSHGRTNKRITSQTCHSRPSRRTNSQNVVKLLPLQCRPPCHQQPSSCSTVMPAARF